MYARERAIIFLLEIIIAAAGVAVIIAALRDATFVAIITLSSPSPRPSMWHYTGMHDARRGVSYSLVNIARSVILVSVSLDLLANEEVEAAESSFAIRPLVKIVQRGLLVEENIPKIRPPLSHFGRASYSLIRFYTKESVSFAKYLYPKCIFIRNDLSGSSSLDLLFLFTDTASHSSCESQKCFQQ